MKVNWFTALTGVALIIAGLIRDWATSTPTTEVEAIIIVGGLILIGIGMKE